MKLRAGDMGSFCASRAERISISPPMPKELMRWSPVDCLARGADDLPVIVFRSLVQVFLRLAVGRKAEQRKASIGADIRQIEDLRWADWLIQQVEFSCLIGEPDEAPGRSVWGR